MPLPVFGARRALDEATAALGAGRLDDAARGFRAYFASRIGLLSRTLRKADAPVAMLAAACALMRADWAELEGIAQLVGDGKDESTTDARAWLALLRAAVAGDTDAVFGRALVAPLPALSGVMPIVMLVAAERGLGRLANDSAARVKQAVAKIDVTPEIRARVAVVVASHALRSGRRADALAELAAIGDAAPPMHRFFAAVARDDYDKARALAAELTPEDRGAAVAFACGLAAGGGADAATRALDVLGGFATAGSRTALVATIVVGRARNGDVDGARALLAEERARFPDATALAAASAWVAIATRDGSAARESLRHLPPGDATAAALRLLTHALRGAHAELIDELRAATPMPDDLAASVASPVLAALARGGATLAETQTPGWLLVEPNDAEGKYAWATMRLRQGVPAAALGGFERAIAMRAELASTSDAPDVARLAVARGKLASRDADGAYQLASAIKSPRLRAVATRLRALALVLREATSRAVTLDAQRFPDFIDELRRAYAIGSTERVLADLVASDSDRLRARSLARAGRLREARQILDATTPEAWDADVDYLRVVTQLIEGASPVDADAVLARALERSPSHVGLHVLRAETRGAIGGADDRLQLLEDARRSVGTSAFLEEALATAYRGARRGLEAKKIGLEELRRSAVDVPPSLAEEIREALALEVPPLDVARRVAKIARAPRASLFPATGLSDRANVLVERARTRAAAGTPLRDRIDAPLQELKRALVSGEVDAARAAELQVVELLAGGAP